MAKKDKSKQTQGSDGRMTIYDYEEKYVRRQNAKGAKLVLSFIVGIVAVFLAWCLFSIVMQVWAINEYAGYAAIGVAVALFIVLFVVPVVKIFKSDYFQTNVNSKHAYGAKRHNKKVRRNIASKMVDFNASVDGVGWYDDKLVGDLEVALKTKDDEGIKTALTALYQGKVKKTAKEIIFKCSLKSAAYSAVSQSNKVDAALVAVVNMQLVKDIIFLYGFRPSDAKLVKIFTAVVRNSLVAYGLGSVQIGNTVVKGMGEAAKGIPILGSLISTLVDSSIQGLTNCVLTTVIGYQTIKYLNKEYNLQNILDGIDVTETEAELQEACTRLETELKKNPAKARPSAV